MSIGFSLLREMGEVRDRALAQSESFRHRKQQAMPRLSGHAASEGATDSFTPHLPVAEPRPVPKEMPRLFRRLDPDKRGQLLRISVSDHYVDVVTSAGASRILLRFSDALDELDGIAGVKIHRSHWVAKCAIARAERVRGKVEIVMTDGTRLPVSRGQWPVVEKLGYIDDTICRQA